MTPALPEREEPINSRLVSLYLILASAVIPLVITLFCLSHGITKIFPHLYYIPIILVSYAYPRRGVYFSVFLSGSYLALVYLFTYPQTEPISSATTLFFFFVAIGVVVAFLSSRLRHHEGLYRAIFDHSGQGIFLVTPNPGSIIAVNARGASFASAAPEDLQGTPFSALWQDPLAYAAFIGRMEVLHCVNAVETAFRTRDGAPRHVSVSGVKLPEGLYSCSVMDITDRVREHEALEKSEAQYRAVVEVQTEMIVRFRPGGTVVFANEAYLRYFGRKRDQIVGRKFRPEILPEDRDRVREHFTTLTPRSPSGRNEHRIRLPTGEIRWQEWTDRAIFSPDGTLLEYQSVGRDITDEKVREEIERKAFAQIDKNIEQLAILGDHIRNPLAVIVGIADLDAGPTSDKIIHQARIIDRIITQLDRGWIESSKIREYLRKHA
ncbi:MAG: PAS domain S-box protein [Methanomicrobiales archaeon]|nr:PAS domain S-box protein [Methanomicrobiales archaeon]